MPVLMHKSKCWLEDSEEEDKSDGELVMGILEQHAVQCQATEEAVREAQQVHLTIVLLFIIPNYMVLALYWQSWCQ